jgi:hypothetical protein
MFKLTTFASLGLIAVSLSAMGCTETTSSENIKTGGIAALIDVYADDDNTATVHVKLVVGGSSSNTYVNLEGDDELTATVGDVTKTLKGIESGIYEANFDDVGEDSEFTVELNRPDDETASDNSGTLPAPFTLDDPADDLSRKDDDLEVTWAPESDDDFNLSFKGDCTFLYDKDVSDTGSHIVKAGSIDSTGGDEPETCDVSVTATRTRAGHADDKFDPESWFRLHQRRKAKFTSNP